jgi:hypothetical protein
MHIKAGDWGLRILAIGILTAVSCGLFAASALAVGDANKTKCPAAESSDSFQAFLPDCRGFELVSQANSDDANIVVGSYGFPEGEHVYYKDFIPVPGGGAENGISEAFLASRSSAGWRQQAISPPEGEGAPEITPKNFSELYISAEAISFTSDFSTAFVNSPFQNPNEDPRLAQNTGMNVYAVPLEGSNKSNITLMSTGDSGPTTQAMIENPAYAGNADGNVAIGWGSFIVGSAGNGSKVFFQTITKLSTAPGTPVDTHSNGSEIYERYDEHTYLAGVLPNGTVPACGAEVEGIADTANESRSYTYGEVAPDGSTVVFHTCTGLYLRNMVEGTTVQLPGESFDGRAGTGSDEEEVIITSGEGKVFEYHITTGQTTEVGEGSRVVAYSASGSKVYYEGPTQGLMFYEEGTKPSLIPGTEGGGYHGAGAAGKRPDLPISTPRGEYLLFIDAAKLTAYENEGHQEAYVYDHKNNQVICISCQPSGQPPGPGAPPPGDEANLIDQFYANEDDNASFYSQAPPFITGESTEEGTRAVFETTASLVPEDTNGIEDVYEWVLLDHYGCTEASATYGADIEGCVYLLSSGLGTGSVTPHGVSGAHLVGASTNLKDVDIETDEAATPETDNASHIYDLREEGGFPFSPVRFGCEPGMCQNGGAVAPAFTEPATVGLTAVGNLATAKKATRKVPAKRPRIRAHAKACKHLRGRKQRRACQASRRRARGTNHKAVRGGRSGGGK